MKYIVDPASNIQSILDSIQPGDVMLFKPGTYAQALVLKTSGILGNPIILEGEGRVIFETPGKPAIETKGESYYIFKNFEAINSVALFEINEKSHNIDIENIKSDKNRFAIRISDGSFIRVRKAHVDNSKNGFRVIAGSDFVFVDIEVYNSKDIWDGMNKRYLNGDGFIFERAVTNVLLERIKTANHWDAGIDCKASNVVISEVLSWGNKNNYKIWGRNVKIYNSLSFKAKRQLRPDGSYVEGNGLTAETDPNGGQGAEVYCENVTFVDNEHRDIHLYAGTTVKLDKCIVARKASAGVLLDHDGVIFDSIDTIWFDSGKPRPSFVGPNDRYEDPKFKDWENGDYRTESGIVGYLGTSAPIPPPPPVPAPEPPPAPAPAPQPSVDAILGIKEGDVLSGKIFIKPNPEIYPKVALALYYLNGKQKGKYAQAPYMFGSKAGYDTKRLPNGPVKIGIRLDHVGKPLKQEKFEFNVIIKN